MPRRNRPPLCCRCTCGARSAPSDQSRVFAVVSEADFGAGGGSSTDSQRGRPRDPEHVRTGAARPGDHRRLILSVLYFFVVGWVCDKAAYVADVRGTKTDLRVCSAPLPDLLLDNVIPDMANSGVVNAFAAAWVLLVFVLLAHPRRVTILRRFAVLYATLLLARSCTIVATSPPAIEPTCRPPAHEPQLLWYGNLLFFWNKSCHDAMYSGHTCGFLLATLFLVKHGIGGLHWRMRARPTRCLGAALHVFLWVAGVGAVLGLLAARVHYTEDVLVAAYVTVSAWVLYHLALAAAATSEPSEKSRVLQWLEGLDMTAADTASLLTDPLYDEREKARVRAVSILACSEPGVEEMSSADDLHHKLLPARTALGAAPAEVSLGLGAL